MAERMLMKLGEPEKSEHSDLRMHFTLRDMERYLQVPRNRALTIWHFPVLYDEPKPLPPATNYLF